MKKYIVALLLSLLASPALAGVSCVLPFNLQNGTPADATQVMANYNALVTCLGNAAAAGANSDITSLNGLTTPIPHNAGGSPVYIGGTSTGSNTAQVVSATVPPFLLSTGNIVTFVAGFRSGLATTVNVQSTGVITVYRKTQLGPETTVGSEWSIGDTVMLQYDGTRYICVSCDKELVGAIIDYAGPTTTPIPGWLVADGSCQPQSTYPALFALIGSTFGACGAGSFALPDGRGNVMAGLDNMGSNGNANRLSDCSTHTTLGGLCGAQQQPIVVANLPSAAVFTVTIPAGQGAHVHAGGQASIQTTQSGTPASPIGWSNSATNTASATLPAMSGTAASDGTDTPVLTVQPLQFINKLIKP